MTTTAKKSANSKTDSAKQPEWSIVTYEQIEARRQDLGIAKSAMAELLGVTNSTYHNWRRGTTVPHESQQEKLLEKMHAGPETIVEKPAKKPAKKPAAPKASADASTNASTNGTGTKKPGRRPKATKRAATKTNSAASITITSSDSVAETRVETPRVSRNLSTAQLSAVSDITAAYINSKKGKLTTAAVCKFIETIADAIP